MKVRVWDDWVEDLVIRWKPVNNDDDLVKCGDVVDIPDQIVHDLIAAREAEKKAHLRFSYALRDAKRRAERIKEHNGFVERMKNNVISRSEKHQFLFDHGWSVVPGRVSLYERNGMVLKMHEAFLWTLVNEQIGLVQELNGYWPCMGA